MTVIHAHLSEELERALQRYHHAHPDAGTVEVVVQKALRRFLLEEGYLVEDETLSDDELEALQSVGRGERDYALWDEVKDTL